MFTKLCSLRVLFVAVLLAAALPAHTATSTEPEPATPVGAYDVSPAPRGVDVTVIIVPTLVPGVWIGTVWANGEPVESETFVLVRRESGGYQWENNKVGPRTGETGAGTIDWDGDHYDSKVTRGDNKGAERRLAPI